jgi:hypothetical protein
MLSERTRQLVNELYGLAGRSGHEDEICSLLFKLAQTSEPGLLPYLIQFLLAKSTNVRTAAQTAVGSLLAEVSPYDLLHVIDLSWGEWDAYWSQWRQLSPTSVRDLAINEHCKLEPAVLGIFSFHRNGFVRHEAVRLLTTIEDGTELPFLLNRHASLLRCGSSRVVCQSGTVEGINPRT